MTPNNCKDDILIRQVTLDDSHNLSALSIQVWLHTYAKNGLQTKISKFVLRQFTPEYFEDIYRCHHQHLFIALHQECLIGFITVDLHSKCTTGDKGYEVVTLYVQEFFQAKGIGKLLVDYCIIKFGHAFWLTTWIHNTQAIDFYHHLGLQQAGYTYFNLDGEKHKTIIFHNK